MVTIKAQHQLAGDCAADNARGVAGFSVTDRNALIRHQRRTFGVGLARALSDQAPRPSSGTTAQLGIALGSGELQDRVRAVDPR
jgi:hypothetical protein